MPTPALVSLRFDDVFRTLVTSGHVIETVGSIESPSGVCSIIEISEEVDAHEKIMKSFSPLEFQLLEELEAGFYTTIWDKNNVIWVYRWGFDKASARKHFSNSREIFTAWSEGQNPYQFNDQTTS